MKMPPIPMTRAAGMGSLPEMLVAATGTSALRRVFRAVRLPLDIGSKPGVRLPLTSLVEIFERAANEAGDRCFGLRVGQQMNPGDFGTWAAYSMSASTLYAAIQRFIRGLRMYQAGAESFLHSAGDRAIWSYRRPYRSDDSGMQHADHVLPPMINFVRAYLGETWTPKAVHVCYPRDSSSQWLEQELGTTVKFDAPGIAVVIDKAALGVERRHAIAIGEQLTIADVLADGTTDSADAVIAVRDILRLRARCGEFDLDGTAKLAGIGPRSLQRELKDRGQSYRRLVDEASMQRAIGLLAQSDQPISAIALSLGYSEPCNFTRAFRRMTGYSPQHYRQIVLANSL